MRKAVEPPVDVLAEWRQHPKLPTGREHERVAGNGQPGKLARGSARGLRALNNRRD